MGSQDTIAESEVLDLLRRIERGEVTLTSRTEPQTVMTGYVEYAASNGWRLTVFAQDSAWEHLAEVESADGRRAEHAALRAYARLRNYLPHRDDAWRCFGLPGAGELRDEVWSGTVGDDEDA